MTTGGRTLGKRKWPIWLNPKRAWSWAGDEYDWARNSPRRGWILGGIAWGLVIGGMPVYPGAWHLLAGNIAVGLVITGGGLLIGIAAAAANWSAERSAS